MTTLQPHTMPVLLLYNLEPDWTSEERDEVTNVTNILGDAMVAEGHPTQLVPVDQKDIGSALGGFDPLEHIVFNWCECVPGIPRSEHRVARALETLGFVFTGASSKALTIAQDKQRVRRILDKAGMPGPQWCVYSTEDTSDWQLFPAIVKAVREHASAGITRKSVVLTPQELRARVAYMLETYKQPVIVEEFVDGREFHVALWGNDPVVMLPPAEMGYAKFSDVCDRVCTFDAKFSPGSLHYEGIETLMPAPLTEAEMAVLEHVCITAYEIVGCRDYARMDLRMRDGDFYVLDVNPNADISADASLASALECAGYTYGAAGSRIVQMAAMRHPVWGGAE